ncbi:MAG TPA: 4Fe-4S binding protein [Firmicutes bacterium]|nr:4Fe-4S binding protein [Bacillota bacterium]
MKELLLLSGKGGTGKTSVAGSFATLAKNAVLVDCDVDAADLHLITHCKIGTENEFRASRKAFIDQSRCSDCGRCAAACRFEAIRARTVDKISCEGCGLCARVCPEDAIKMVEVVSGYWYQSDTPYGPLIHARLLAGEGNSGKLVSLLRERAREVAEATGRDMILLDGPPGIGCPVMASAAGVSMVLIVIEPTVSGFNDFRRVLEVCRHFGVKTAACINKVDLDEKISEQIERRCEKEGIRVLGRIPIDHDVTRAMVQKMTVVEYSDGPAAKEIQSMWKRIQEEMANV